MFSKHKDSFFVNKRFKTASIAEIDIVNHSIRQRHVHYQRIAYKITILKSEYHQFRSFGSAQSFGVLKLKFSNICQHTFRTNIERCCQSFKLASFVRGKKTFIHLKRECHEGEDIYSGVKKECDSIQNFFEVKSNQKYNKTYPKKIQNIPLRRKKSYNPSTNLFATTNCNRRGIEKVLLCTQIDFLTSCA